MHNFFTLSARKAESKKDEKRKVILVFLIWGTLDSKYMNIAIVVVKNTLLVG